MSKKLRRKTADLRKQHVLEAALRVFAKKGFRRTTVREVAVAAGVADGTIYNVFPNKDALLLAFLRRLEGDENAVIPEIVTPDDLREVFRQMIRRRWQAFSPEILSMSRVVLSEAL